MKTGPLAIDDLHAPGYVWLSCQAYPSLPDNTQGRIGYHAVYRPLAVHANGVPQYQGNEHITDAMRADIRAYFAACEDEWHAAQQAQEEALAILARETVQRHSGPPARPGLTTPCPHCQTYCAGDCGA